jgi:His-Xaa-Ser system protein HxsD
MATTKPKRAPASKRRAPAAKRAKIAAPAAAGEITFELDARPDGPEPILGAAYLLMDRAYAFISGDKAKILSVTLRPKGARGAAELAALKRAFEEEFTAQKLRWAVARNNRTVREYVAENALALAQEFAARASAAPAEPAAEQLTTEQRSEIERLIAEVETEISQMNVKKELPDPKGAALSWEAVQQADKGGKTA